MPMCRTKISEHGKWSMRVLTACVVLLCLWLVLGAHVSGHEVQQESVPPMPCFSPVDSLMESAVANALIPGGVVCVVADTGILYLHAYGCRALLPDTLPMTVNTVFDLASMSKPLVAMAVLRLAEDSLLQLNQKVNHYLAEFEGDATVAHLLTHTSGLPPYVNLKKLELRYGVASAATLTDYICHCPRRFLAGTDYAYSCLNYIALQRLAEQVSGMDFATLCAERVFRPLGMLHTAYCPPAGWRNNMASTELQPDSTILCGIVHDPLARLACGGVSGNAGIFSTAEDLARLAMFLLAGKDLAEVQALAAAPDSLAFSGRTCGWALKTEDMRFMGTLAGEHAYGHTGYTGTSMLIDPERSLAVVLLTNRVHPHDKGSVNSLRAAVADAVFSATAQPDFMVITQ